MSEKKLYYAVSRRGQGVIYTDKPERDGHFGVWRGRIEACYNSVVHDMECSGLITLPDMKFTDEPLELRLTLDYG